MFREEGEWFVTTGVCSSHLQVARRVVVAVVPLVEGPLSDLVDAYDAEQRASGSAVGAVALGMGAATGGEV